MKSTHVLLGLVFLAASAPLMAAQVSASRLHEITNPDTRAWWQATEALSNDAMEGRDIGSAGYNRAAQSVAKQFAAEKRGQVHLHPFELSRGGLCAGLTPAKHRSQCTF